MATDFSKYGSVSKIDTTEKGSATDFSKYGVVSTVQPEIKPKEKGYIERVSSQFQQAGQDVMTGVKQGAESYQQGTDKGTFGGVLEATGGLLRSGLRTAGAVAGSAFTPILEAPVVKPLTEKVIGNILEYKPVQELVTKAAEISKKYPNASKDIKNIIDIATLEGGKAVQAPLKTEAGLLTKDITGATKAMLTPSEDVVQRKVVDLFTKSIKPTAKKTLGQAEQYDNSIINALKTIKSKAPELNIEDATGELISGRTPQTIQELAQGLDQTKDLVFKQYDSLAKQAGTKGAVIDAKPIADEILKVADNKALKLTNPEVIKYAQDWSNRLKEFDVLDTETTQEVIKMMNNNLKSFYQNPTYNIASKVAVDAGIANNFRKALDAAIESATGEQYQMLKKQYSALKSIENDVVRASMRDARKNVKGLLDYTDMFTSGQMVGGILSLNPAMFTKGAVERGFKEWIKLMNDPNRAIKNIFEKLDTNTVREFVPKSATGKYLKNPKLGMSIEDVTKNNPLYQEAKNYKSAEDFANKAPSKVIDELRNQGIRGAEQRMAFWEKATKGMDKTPVIDSMNPTGGVLVDYTPEARMKSKLADNITTLDKTMGKSPDEMITIYRGAPKNQKSIVGGDFVTTNPELARSYTGDGNILSKKVKLSDVLDDINEPLGEEYIYRPKSQVNSLISEAKNYKSAEEFVKAQGDEILHGTDKKFSTFDKTKIGMNEPDSPTKQAFFFTDSLETAKSYGQNIVKKYGKFDKPLTIDAEGQSYGDFRENLREVLIKAEKEGNDAVIIKNLSDRKDWGNYEPATHYAVLDTNKLLSKSQLTDIWNKANKK